ncbi:MAG: hypothetical protein G01um101433_972, partial [Parcubacteria group bacterium Gr01-1014_33]
AEAGREFPSPSTPFLPAPPERFGILRNAEGVSLKNGSRIYKYRPFEKRWKGKCKRMKKVDNLFHGSIPTVPKQKKARDCTLATGLSLFAPISKKDGKENPAIPIMRNCVNKL